jgi:zinc protease
LTKVRAQLRARFVYDGDSVTDIAHQLGYFETIGSWRAYPELIPRLATVTLDQVNAAARRYLTKDNRTIGWFEPELSSTQMSVPAVDAPAAS